jgi:hypothetical protein
MFGQPSNPHFEYSISLVDTLASWKLVFEKNSAAFLLNSRIRQRTFICQGQFLLQCHSLLSLLIAREKNGIVIKHNMFLSKNGKISAHENSNEQEGRRGWGGDLYKRGRGFQRASVRAHEGDWVRGEPTIKWNSHIRARSAGAELG